MIAWDKVDPNDFELLCFQLLGEIGFQNRNWYKGPRDGGRDIVASKLLETIPSRVYEEKWIIECKRKTSGALSVSDLAESLERAAAHNPDRYLIITTSHLTIDTKDWLDKRADALKIRIGYIENHELEELIIKYPTQISRKLIAHHLGTALAPYNKARIKMDQILKEVLPDDKYPSQDQINSLRDAYKDIKSLYKDIPSDLGTVCLSENHKIIYHKNGFTTTLYEIEILNISTFDLREDNFRFYGDIPVYDNKSLNIKCSGLASNYKKPYIFRLDTGALKLVDFILPKGIKSGKKHKYSFSFSWPYPPPLEKIRYYSTYGRRYKHLVNIKIQVPKKHSIQNCLVTTSIEGQSVRLPDPKLTKNTVCTSYNFLSRGATFSIYFQVYRG